MVCSGIKRRPSMLIGGDSCRPTDEPRGGSIEPRSIGWLGADPRMRLRIACCSSKKASGDIVGLAALAGAAAAGDGVREAELVRAGAGAGAATDVVVADAGSCRDFCTTALATTAVFAGCGTAVAITVATAGAVAITVIGAADATTVGGCELPVDGSTPSSGPLVRRPPRGCGDAPRKLGGPEDRAPRWLDCEVAFVALADAADDRTPRWDKLLLLLAALEVDCRSLIAEILTPDLGSGFIVDRASARASTTGDKFFPRFGAYTRCSSDGVRTRASELAAALVGLVSRAGGMPDAATAREDLALPLAELRRGAGVRISSSSARWPQVSKEAWVRCAPAWQMRLLRRPKSRLVERRAVAGRSQEQRPAARQHRP